jgi:hypothetical protein
MHGSFCVYIYTDALDTYICARTFPFDTCPNTEEMEALTASIPPKGKWLRDGQKNFYAMGGEAGAAIAARIPMLSLPPTAPEILAQESRVFNMMTQVQVTECVWTFLVCLSFLSVLSIRLICLPCPDKTRFECLKQTLEAPCVTLVSLVGNSCISTQRLRCPIILCIHAYTHTYIHTYIHTYTCAGSSPWLT